MVRCPKCGARVGLRRLLGDVRRLPCARCPAILSLGRHAGALPGLCVLFVVAPAVRGVRDGSLGLGPAILECLVVVLGAAWLGFRRSQVKVVRMRRERRLVAGPAAAHPSTT